MTSSSPRSATLPIFLVLAVALAAGLGLLAAQHWFNPSAGEPPALQGGLTYPAPRPVAPFELDLPSGEPLDQAALRGHFTLVFIGFTHCPDVCPTTLAQLGAALRQLPDMPDQQQPRILFVSVDPERDTAEVASRYARHFHPDALAATADHARLEPFARNLGMVYMQSPLGDDGYTVDHSASVAVLDPDVRLVAQLRPPFDPETIAADLRALIEHHR